MSLSIGKGKGRRITFSELMPRTDDDKPAWEQKGRAGRVSGPGCGRQGVCQDITKASAFRSTLMRTPI